MCLRMAGHRLRDAWSSGVNAKAETGGARHGQRPGSLAVAKTELSYTIELSNRIKQ